MPELISIKSEEIDTRFSILSEERGLTVARIDGEVCFRRCDLVRQINVNKDRKYPIDGGVSAMLFDLLDHSGIARVFKARGSIWFPKTSLNTCVESLTNPEFLKMAEIRDMRIKGAAGVFRRKSSAAAKLAELEADLVMPAIKTEPKIISSSAPSFITPTPIEAIPVKVQAPIYFTRDERGVIQVPIKSLFPSPAQGIHTFDNSITGRITNIYRKYNIIKLLKVEGYAQNSVKCIPVDEAVNLKSVIYPVTKFPHIHERMSDRIDYALEQSKKYAETLTKIVKIAPEEEPVVAPASADVRVVMSPQADDELKAQIEKLTLESIESRAMIQTLMEQQGKMMRHFGVLS